MQLQVIKNYFSNDQINELNIEINKLIKSTDIKNYIWKYYDGSNNANISRIEYFIKYSDKLKNISESFFKNSNYILMKDKINFKHVNGEGFVAHQDITAGWNKYGLNHITVAIPLQDTTIENGCLFFANMNIDKMLTPEFTNLSDDIIPPENYKPCLTNCGDIIIFDSFIPHKSFINKSKNIRSIIYFTYVLNNNKFDNAYEKYHEDKFINNPPDIYKEKNISYRSNNTFDKIIYN